MILIDSNVPMYVVGSEHPNKAAAQAALQRVVVEGERLVTDAEVFQEILHRYVAIGRRDAIQPAFELLLELADEVFPIELPDVDAAKSLVLTHKRISARDALHVAVMQRRDVGTVMSFDRGLDGLLGITRISE